MARPEIPIDWDIVDKMIEQQCTADEIAGTFYLSHNRFYERFSEKHPEGFSIYRQSFNARGKGMLRQKQWEKALEGCVPLLVKLGDIYLDQNKPPKDDIDIKSLKEATDKLNEALKALPQVKE